MAKKKTTKKKVKSTNTIKNEKILPQNIIPFGERVEENKNIYILQQVYKDIHKFTQNKTTNESGGMLIGYTIEEFGKTNIVVIGFIEAKYCEATPTTLKFTHETWDYVHKEMDKKYPEGKIVGWIHTHPDFGIFLSEYDKFIHENFFNEEYQIAYVVDPIQDIEGFYFWINGKIERCKGFYVYDKTGAKINVTKEEINKTANEDKLFSFSIKNVLIGVLSVIVVFLIFANMSQNKELDKLQRQQETLAESANASLAVMQQQINSLNSQINRLLATLDETEQNSSSENNQKEESNEGNSVNDTTTQSSDNEDGNSEATSKNQNDDEQASEVKENE
jgi:proteasome lid subunit RPN8/RPN11